MSNKNRKDAKKWLPTNPICVFCDIQTMSTTIFRGESLMIRGWRCPKCGFTLIHPGEINKALEILRETAAVWRE
jgi:hypothetical protein